MTCEVALVYTYNDLDTRMSPSCFVFLFNECQYTARFAVVVYVSSVFHHSSSSFPSCSCSCSCSSPSYQLFLNVLGQLLNYTSVCTYC